jgi:hypothetical protein
MLRRLFEAANVRREKGETGQKSHKVGLLFRVILASIDFFLAMGILYASSGSSAKTACPGEYLM